MSLRRRPGGEIGLDEGAAGEPLARLAQHVGRGIDADDLGLRKASEQQLGRVAGSAAQIEYAPRRVQRHLRQQVAWRPRALILEFQVLPRAPVRGHQRENFLYLIRCGMVESVPSRRFLSSS